MEVATSILYSIHTRMIYFTEASDAEGMELAMVIFYLLVCCEGDTKTLGWFGYVILSDSLCH